MAKALFLTYNSIGEPGKYPNGIVERNGHKACVVQHPRGKSWGVDGAVQEEPDQPMNFRDAKTEEDKARLSRVRDDRKGLVQGLYGEAAQSDDVYDFVVVYVGTGGSEGAIELVASRYPHEKLRFVMCDCNISGKAEMIDRIIGDDVSQYWMCECGGRRSMDFILDNFLETGIVGIPAELVS